MISFRQFALRRGSRTLIANVDLTLQSGWSVGVVGRNGCGKSSLFAALKGEIEAEVGNLDMPSRVRMAAVAQETPALPDPAIEYVLGGDEEVAAVLRAEAAAAAAEDHEAVAAAHIRIEELNGYDARARAGRLLHGLGFPAETHERPVASFSGGWRVRLNLARALMAPSDLLLLDEPTNHLDLDAVLWLEEWLRRYQGTLLVISHDREFMDGVISHTLHLHDGTAKLYTGDYTAFERQRAEHLRQQQIAHEREQAERAHLQSFIDRFKAKASKAKQAQSRVKRLEKMAGTEAVRAERGFSFDFAKPEKLPTSMLRLDHVDAGYGDHVVLHDVGFGLEAGDRIGLLGPNGAGKSTLVKSLVGDLEPLAGERAFHRDVRIGYFAQHTVESLREGASPFDHLQEKAPGVGAQPLRDFLGTWNFPADRAFEPVDAFSGGERARLALALIAWDKPNLLLLDEPTNHLDLDMREALADALAEFDGAIVLVSHDRHLLGMVCDEFWRVADGVVEPFDGDLDDYARWLRSRQTTKTTAAVASAPVAAESSRDRRKATAEQREKEKPLRARIKKIEGLVETMDRELGTIQGKLADPSIYEGSTSELMKLSQRQGDLRREKETLEAEWMDLLEQIEA
ncbi:ATP-binding cassette subfamily F protein 3 [Luteibacter sp. Sphag1AF]|uniref:ATP-binding cassette domain-containing protein n=1 Tax=Luteibacter sp. Sphag1AF TaxID=2587031 RepID=UPI00160884CC|nr:ATP-binding cassette domain-containing protein [Luteibacter sp. Sphag1AF]MBB3226960.1 ATP-binding cassette subfamily F protein 3 [Luteibacter sp. Sphag1AF]